MTIAELQMGFKMVASLAAKLYVSRQAQYMQSKTRAKQTGKQLEAWPQQSPTPRKTAFLAPAMADGELRLPHGIQQSIDLRTRACNPDTITAHEAESLYQRSS